MKMENNYYQKKNTLKEEYLNNLNSQIPEWAKKLVELYTSPMKYQMDYELKNIKK